MAFRQVHIVIAMSPLVTIVLGCLLLFQGAYSGPCKYFFQCMIWRCMYQAWHLVHSFSRFIKYTFNHLVASRFSAVGDSWNNANNCHCGFQACKPEGYCEIWGLPSWPKRHQMFRGSHSKTGTVYIKRTPRSLCNLPRGNRLLFQPLRTTHYRALANKNEG